MEIKSEIVLVEYDNGSVRLVTDCDTMFCDLCPYQTTKRKLLIQHMTSNHFYPDRECQICGKRLNKMQLRLHMRFHDLKFVCDDCGKRFGDSKSLRKHKNSRVCGEKYRESLAYKTHKCNYCDYRTHTAKLLLTHFRTLHVPKDQICPKCNKEMTLKQYRSHKDYCNREYVFCEFCQKRFAHPTYLKAHCKKKHFDKIKDEPMTEDVPVVIVKKEENHSPVEFLEEEETQDAVIYTDFETLEEPMGNEIQFEVIFDERDMAPPDEPPPEIEVIQYFCPICSQNADNVDELVSHMNQRHQDRDNECPVCHKLYSKSGLQRHMRYHTKKNICQKCGAGFAEPSLLKAHLERKIPCLPPTFEELQEDPTYMMKQFPCDFCFYRGETRQSLQRHVRNAHTSVANNVECPECGKVVTQQNLKAHRKTHVKVKCQVCNKWLSDSKFFKVHMENHSKPAKEKPREFEIPEPITGKGGYSCPECNFETKERRFLLQHLKVKHAPKDFKCEFEGCQAKKFTQTQLRLHQRFHRLSFKCESCGSGFPDRRDLRRHVDGKRCFKKRKSRMATKVEESVTLPVIEEIELDPNPCFDSIPNALGIYECQQCNFETDSKPELIEHWSLLHAPRDQPCTEPQCNGKLFSRAQLELHMKFHAKKLSQGTRKPRIGPKCYSRIPVVTIKSLEIPITTENSWIHRCLDCDFLTVDKETLKQHRASAHNHFTEDMEVIFLVENVPENTRNSVYQCGECDFETNKEVYLTQHRQMNHESHVFSQ